jgi:hypothetical protein
MDRKTTKPEKPKPAEKPISLHPLKFEEAVEGLLRTKPSTRQSLKNSGEDSVE